MFIFIFKHPLISPKFHLAVPKGHGRDFWRCLVQFFLELTSQPCHCDGPGGGRAFPPPPGRLLAYGCCFDGGCIGDAIETILKVLQVQITKQINVMKKNVTESNLNCAKAERGREKA